MAARHTHDLAPFAHSHAFGDAASPRRERALWWVTAVTLAAMVLELVVGYWSGSLALVADGWHMGTHALALGGAALAAVLARRAHGSARFAFGGWKIEVLAAYSSGLLLLAVSAWITIDALLALASPRVIAYHEAIGVAVIGLAVNAVCAWVLARGDAPGRASAGAAVPRRDHGFDHDHDREDRYEHHREHEHEGERSDEHAHERGRVGDTHARSHGHRHEADHDHAPTPAHGPHSRAAGHRRHDHNFQAAYLHVLADALTSVLAIVALSAGLWWGARWLDPVVAIAGGALIAHWAFGVLRDSARALVDVSALAPLRDAVRATLEGDGDARVADLHIWQIGPDAWSAALSVVADRPLEPSTYRARLQPLRWLRHVTIEVHRCRGESGAKGPHATPPQ